MWHSKTLSQNRFFFFPLSHKMVAAMKKINSQNINMTIGIEFVLLFSFYLPREFQFGDNNLAFLLIHE